MGTKSITQETRDARYFPATTESGVTGRVSRVSRLPLLFSSLKTRMVRAGIKRLKRRGRYSKKPLSSARFIRKKVAKNIIPATSRNTTQTIYGIGLVNKAESSREQMTAQEAFFLLDIAFASSC